MACGRRSRPTVLPLPHRNEDPVSDAVGTLPNAPHARRVPTWIDLDHLSPHRDRHASMCEAAQHAREWCTEGDGPDARDNLARRDAIPNRVGSLKVLST